MEHGWLRAIRIVSASVLLGEDCDSGAQLLLRSEAIIIWAERVPRAGMTRAARPQRGDVLILATARSFEVYAVGRVVRDGQQDFNGDAGVKYSRVRPTAEAAAKVIVEPGRRIYFRDLDTGEWSEVLT